MKAAEKKQIKAFIKANIDKEIAIKEGEAWRKYKTSFMRQHFLDICNGTDERVYDELTKLLDKVQVELDEEAFVEKEKERLKKSDSNYYEYYCDLTDECKAEEEDEYEISQINDEEDDDE